MPVPDAISFYAVPPSAGPIDGYCLGPETKILYSDLTWKKIGDAQIGDKIVGFDEYPPKGVQRKLHISSIDNISRVFLPSYKITLSDDRVVYASEEHMWLTYPYLKGVWETGRQAQDGKSTSWIKTKDLTTSMMIKQIGTPWEKDNSFEGGYLSGVFDGEGFLVNATSPMGFRCSFAQNPGKVMDKTKLLLDNFGIKNYIQKNPKKKCQTLHIQGLNDTFKFLGTFQPSRLMEIVPNWIEGKAPNKTPPPATIKSIDFLGKQLMISISTSTKTLFAEGLFSHNSYCGLKFVQELNRMGIKTPWRDDDCPISISFCQPDWYSQETSQYRIFYTPWESTIIPDGWVMHMERGNEMWTTSQWCKDVLHDNGLKKDISVVPHGIDKDEWEITKRRTRKNFTFLHMGEPATRKGGQMVYDAFVEVFGGNKDVKLVMKANGFTTVRHRSPFGPITENPQVELITDVVDIFHLSEIFQSADCMVYPSSGEGFGMIPFQAICTGMPTIVPPYGGVADFAKYAIPMKYSVKKTDHDYHLGNWCFPDEKNLQQVMLDVYNNFPDYSAQAYENGLEARKKYSWSTVVETAIEQLTTRIG